METNKLTVSTYTAQQWVFRIVKHLKIGIKVLISFFNSSTAVRVER